MAKRRYDETCIALMDKEEGTDDSVCFPDFPDCITAANTLDEARRLAEEALAFHIEGMVEGGEAIPDPSSLAAVMADPHHREMLPFLVTVPRPSRRAIQLSITMGAALVDRIDYAVGGRGRSRFLADAAERMLAEREAAE